MVGSTGSKSNPLPVPETVKFAAELVEGTRARKTFARLAAAVLELAVEQDISKASVAQVARRAGVNRTTFYKYSSSPVELLVSVLSHELDKVRETFTRLRKTPGADPKEVFARSARSYYLHVSKHARIYSAGHTSTALVIRDVLAEHIRGAVRLMFEEQLETLPFDAPGSLEIFAAFYGHGVAAATEAWLAMPEPRNMLQLQEILVGSLPSWLSYSKSAEYAGSDT